MRENVREPKAPSCLNCGDYYWGNPAMLNCVTTVDERVMRQTTAGVAHVSTASRDTTQAYGTNHQ